LIAMVFICFLSNAARLPNFSGASDLLAAKLAIKYYKPFNDFNNILLIIQE